MSLVGDENSSQKVKILRDTGATQSLMLDSVLPITENSFTGANVLISGTEMGILEVPLHEVNIKSSLINGNIVIGMRPSLPVEGISLILRNDLAGEEKAEKALMRNESRNVKGNIPGKQEVESKYQSFQDKT